MIFNVFLHKLECLIPHSWASGWQVFKDNVILLKYCEFINLLKVDLNLKRFLNTMKKTYWLNSSSSAQVETLEGSWRVDFASDYKTIQIDLWIDFQSVQAEDFSNLPFKVIKVIHNHKDSDIWKKFLWFVSNVDWWKRLPFISDLIRTSL